MKEFLSRISSRKFISYAIGTVIFIVTNKLPWQGWLILTGIFIGGNVAEGIIKAFTRKGD